MDTCPDTSAPEAETDPTTHERPLDTRPPVTSIIAIVLLVALGAIYLMRAWFYTSERLNTADEDMYAMEIVGFLTRGFIPAITGFLCAIVLLFAKEAARIGVLAVAGAWLFAELNSIFANFAFFVMQMGTTQFAFLIVDLVVMALAIGVGVLLSLGPVSRWLRANRKIRRVHADSSIDSTTDPTPQIRPGWIFIVVMLLGLIALAQIAHSVAWFASIDETPPVPIWSYAVPQVVIILLIAASIVLTFLGVSAGRTIAIAASGNAILSALVWFGVFMTTPPADVAANPTDSTIAGATAAAYTLSAAAGIATLVLLSGRQCVDWFYVKRSAAPAPIPTQTSTPS